MRRLSTLACAVLLGVAACSRPSSSSDADTSVAVTPPDVGVDVPNVRAGMIEVRESKFFRGCDDDVERYCENDPDADILLDGPMRLANVVPSLGPSLRC